MANIKVTVIKKLIFSSARYYKKKKILKECCEKYENLSKEEKEKRDNMGMNDIIKKFIKKTQKSTKNCFCLESLFFISGKRKKFFSSQLNKLN